MSLDRVFGSTNCTCSLVVRIPCALIALSMFSPTGIGQEKQTITIAAPLNSYPGLPTQLPLTKDQATAVVDAVLGSNQPTGGAVMLHAVTYLTDKPAAQRQDWYTVDRTATPKLDKIEAAGDFDAAGHYKRQRIFGDSKLGLVYLHILQAARRSTVDQQLHSEKEFGQIKANLNSVKTERDSCPTAMSAADCLARVTRDADNSIAQLKGAMVKDAGNDQLGTLNAKVNALVDTRAKATDRRTPTLDEMLTIYETANVEKTIQELLVTGSSGQITLVAEGANLTGRKLTFKAVTFGSDDYFVVKGFEGLAKLTYTAEITSKESAPYSNLKAIVGFAIGAQSSLPLNIPVNLALMGFAGGGTFETTHTTSDISVSGTYAGADGKDVTLGPQVYDNERRYWYDFSLVLPIKSYNNLTYDATANGLTARNIKKNNLYAAFNFGFPRDTKRARFQYVPVLLYGIPIASQPLKHHLFAGSVGLNYVNFFVGTALDEENFYHDFTKPLTGSNVFQVWRTHLTYGLNFDPQPLIKSLSGKK
ncbi:MAG TPA: hypothetical protein VGR73_23825 [Bryobacteraceae bacterium]|nr:hypothetical protein [Bryobacteraceae bacterium]